MEKHGNSGPFYVLCFADRRLIRRLVFRAHYKLECDKIAPPAVRAALDAITTQHFKLIDEICVQGMVK